MQDWRAIGPHRFRSEDRLLLWEPHGAATQDHCRQFLAEIDAIGARQQPVFLVFDQRLALPASSAVRRMLIEYLRDVRPVMFCAFVHSPVTQRAMNQLIVSAARLLYGYELRHANFDSVDAALRQLRTLRDGGTASDAS